MLLGIIAGAVVYVVSTHLISRERWRLGWDREVAREALAYGAPLIPNGIALAVASMGDRFLIGSFLGLTPMAYYNASSTAAFTPRFVIMRMLGAVTLPTFLRVGREGIVTSRLIDYYGLALSGISSVYSATFLCFGAWAIGLVFGERYTPSQALVSAIALSVYMKYLTSLPTLPALVFGQTKLVLTSTVLTSLSLACAGIAVLISPDLPSFVFGIAVGEFLTVLWSVVISIKVYGLAGRLAWFNVLFPIAVGTVAHFATMAVPIAALGTRVEIYLAVVAALAIGYATALKLARLPWLAEYVRILRSSRNATVTEGTV
jgi:PST family polysaccharide transporter